MYGFWDIKHNRIIFCHIGLFFTLWPPNNPENQTFEKMKKNPENIIILHMSTINKYHMMYDSWDMECHRQNFFLFWTIFGPFTPPTPLHNSKNQNFEKMERTSGDIMILHKCTINDNYMIYGSWDINCNSQIFFVILGHFLHFYLPKSPKTQNFKKWKKPWRYHNFTLVQQKSWLYAILFLIYGTWRM